MSITFAASFNRPGRVIVSLSGKRVGEIVRVVTGDFKIRFQYQPNGTKVRGALFQTLAECKRDVIGEGK